MDVVRRECPMENLTESIGGGFFGYFDKTPWCARKDRDIVLLHRTELFNRLPQSGETVELGMLDTASKEFRRVGVSQAWNFQQGAMLQWLPGTIDTVVFNDMVGVCPIGRTLNVATGKTAEHPAFAALSPNGREALSISYGRLTAVKPEYGYAGAKDLYAADGCPSNDGIWRVDLDHNTSELLISTQRIAACEPEEGMTGAIHYVNHVLYNWDGSRISFLHRYINAAGTQRTRLLTCNSDGRNLKVAISGMASHFGWRNTDEILAWAGERKVLGGIHRGFLARLPLGRAMKQIYRALGKPATIKAGLLNDRYILFDVKNETKTTIGKGSLTTDGHCSFRRDGDWFVTDTYPDRNGKAFLVLCSLLRDKAYIIREFWFPPELDNEVRCDLHPRWHPYKPLISVDMVIGGRRHLAQLDISSIVDAKNLSA